jgi:hypothetical protein
MKTRLALASILAALACASAAHANPYPQCDAKTYAGAVCSVRGWLADEWQTDDFFGYRHGYGRPDQPVQCYYAGPRRKARWSCHTKRTHFIVYGKSQFGDAVGARVRAGEVWVLLVLGQ